MDQNSGMLFIFPKPSVYQFWMKDTLMALDIIWLDQYQNVISIEHNLQPCQSEPCPSYGPKEPSLYVLELNSGMASKWNVKVGQRAEFNLD